MSGCGGSSIIAEPLMLNDEHISLVLESVTSQCIPSRSDEDLATTTLSITTADLSTPSFSSTVTINPTSSLILTEDPISNELTVCQYVLPGDLVVGGFEEVVEEVELGGPWSLSSACLPSTSSDQLQLLTQDSSEDHMLFTVVDDVPSKGTTTNLDASVFQNDMIVEKYYQYMDDVRLVGDDSKLESVHVNGASQTTLNGAVLSADMIVKEEFVDDCQTDDSSHFTVIETSKLNEMVSGDVIEISDCTLDSKSNMEPLSYSTDLTDVSDLTIPGQITDFSAYPNIVLGFVDGRPSGKTVRLNVHKVSRSEKLVLKNDNKKLLNGFEEDDTVKCKECDIYFKKSDDLKAHMEAHLVKLQNSCPLCSIEFPNKSALQVHIRQHFTKSHACNLCSERFANKGLLRTHKLRKHRINVSTITSSVSNGSVNVNYSTVTTTSANNTRDVTQTVATPVIIRSTNKSSASTITTSSSTLSSGVKSPRPSTTATSTSTVITTSNCKVFKCSLCKTVFSCRAEIKQHSTTHWQKPFKCEQCGATFTQNGSLQVHIRRHRGEKPFTCNLCGNSYTRAFSLKVHMKTHTGEKPHTCEYCSSSFITSSHLNVHRRIHTGERPFSCPECSATFITTSHLNVHKRIHLLPTPDPVKCMQCNITFRDNVQLRMHRKAQHLQGNGSSGGYTSAKKKKNNNNNSNHPTACRCKQCFKICPQNRLGKTSSIANP